MWEPPRPPSSGELGCVPTGPCPAPRGEGRGFLSAGRGSGGEIILHSIQGVVWGDRVHRVSGSVSWGGAVTVVPPRAPFGICVISPQHRPALLPHIHVGPAEVDALRVCRWALLSASC